MQVPPEASWVIIYDGQCRLCTAGAPRLASWFVGTNVELVDYHAPDALTRFGTSITPEACQAALHLVDPSGRVFRGAEAVARAIASRGRLWRVAMAYYVPGVRWMLDRMYGLVAENRYRIAGRTGSCVTGTCVRPRT